jgi:2-polyprenyl-3-methyl-5-hydroxy-6-metoxy-1,4-benzoquinol methylase
MVESSHGPEPVETLLTCHVCGSADPAQASDLAGLRGVTSDCKPWPRAAMLAACRACGLIQKPGTADWLETIAQVYDAYTIYHQSPGAEQTVFDGASGASAPRSERLLRRLLAECRLPERGRLLDIGCGNGVLLRTFSAIAPAWTLAGADLDDRHRATVEAIPSVERFYAGPAEEIPDQFDVITMQHVLEHVPEPVDLLGKLARRLNPGGVLFVQVPNILDNPFDLMVVDHSSHFAPQTIGTAVSRAGLQSVVLATDWAPKELTVVAAAGDDGRAEVAPFDPSGAVEHLDTSLRWLAATAADARAAAGTAAFGLLGTSIAATWLANMLDGAVQFFADEDPQRIGRPFMERPVLHPSGAPAGAGVYIVFPPAQARAIRDRLAQTYPTIRWLVPPT